MRDHLLALRRLFEPYVEHGAQIEPFAVEAIIGLIDLAIEDCAAPPPGSRLCVVIPLRPVKSAEPTDGDAA